MHAAGRWLRLARAGEMVGSAPPARRGVPGYMSDCIWGEPGGSNVLLAKAVVAMSATQTQGQPSYQRANRATSLAVFSDSVSNLALACVIETLKPREAGHIHV